MSFLVDSTHYNIQGRQGSRLTPWSQVTQEKRKGEGCLCTASVTFLLTQDNSKIKGCLRVLLLL